MTSIAPLGATPPVASVAAARTVTSNDSSSLARASSTAGPAGGSVEQSIDPGLDITVLKFFSSAGDLTQSFPSQRQLASYQVYGLGGSEGQGVVRSTPSA